MTNIAISVYTNNQDGYVTASVTNGLAGTNYVNSSSLAVSNNLVTIGNVLSNNLATSIISTNTRTHLDIGSTNAQEIIRVTAQIATTNVIVHSDIAATNAAEIARVTSQIATTNTRTHLDIAATNLANLTMTTNLIRQATNNVYESLVSATNGFVRYTNGTAQSLILKSNAFFGDGTAQTIQMSGTPYFGLTGAGSIGVDGTYGQQTSSIWTNFANGNYTILLSGGIYYAQSNSVTLYAFTNFPTSAGTLVNGINPVPAATLGWTFNLNGGVFTGQFNSTNATQKTIQLIGQYGITNNSQQQITLFNTNNVFYGTLIGSTTSSATNAQYLGGLYYTNYVTFGSIGSGYLTNNNNIIISGELQGSGTTNIILNPTATFTNDVNSLARAIATSSTNSLLTPGATNNIDAAKITIGTLPDARLSGNIPRLDIAATFLDNVTALAFFGDGSGLTGVSDTPWTQNHSAAGFSLSGASSVSAAAITGTAGTFGSIGTSGNISAATFTGSGASLTSIPGTALVISGTPDGTKFLRDDFSWQTAGGGGSATNAIALFNGFGTNTTLIAGKSVTATNIVTTNIVPIGIQPITIVGANNGGTGVSPNFIMTPQASTSPGVHGSLYLQPGYSDGTGFVGGTNFVGRFVFSGISTFNHYAGQNTFVHQYAALPIMVLQPDYGASFQTNIFQILTNGQPIVYVDKFDALHAPMDATNLFNAGVLTNGFASISSITNGAVIPANVVTNAIYLTSSTASGTASITSNTLAITTFVTLPSGLITNAFYTIKTNYNSTGTITNIETVTASGLTSVLSDNTGSVTATRGTNGSVTFSGKNGGQDFIWNANNNGWLNLGSGSLIGSIMFVDAVSATGNTGDSAFGANVNVSGVLRASSIAVTNLAATNMFAGSSIFGGSVTMTNPVFVVTNDAPSLGYLGVDASNRTTLTFDGGSLTNVWGSPIFTNAGAYGTNIIGGVYHSLINTNASGGGGTTLAFGSQDGSGSDYTLTGVDSDMSSSFHVTIPNIGTHTYMVSARVLEGGGGFTVIHFQDITNNVQFGTGIIEQDNATFVGLSLINNPWTITGTNTLTLYGSGSGVIKCANSYITYFQIQ